MRSFLSFLFFVGFSFGASAAQTAIAITATQTGLTGSALSGTPTTSALNLEASQVTRQLSLTLAVTPGTSLVVDVRCYESQNASVWEEIVICDSATPKAACVPDVRQFTLASYTGVVKYFTSRWELTKKYVKCSFDDPEDGSGTITVSGARS